MSCPSASDNASIIASALTSLTGSPVITQSDYQIMNENNLTGQNINPVSLDSIYNTYLAGGAVQTNPNDSDSQQNDDNPGTFISCSLSYNLYLQQYIYPNSIVIPNDLMLQLQQQIPQQILQQISQQVPQQVPQQIPQQIPVIPQQIPQQISQPQISQYKITIKIKYSLNGMTFPINNVPTTAKVSAIKYHIERITKISSNQQRLIYSGILLNDNSKLSDYNILTDNSIIYLNLTGNVLRDVISFIDSSFLDPPYDCDFTNVKDDKTFMRGSFVYRRPCGWKRIAVKVLNKYGSNAWLGSNKKGAWRYDSDPMEWPVSYHGTDKFNAKSIAETGFDITKGKRFKFGYGIYSTPDIDIAALYAKKFIHNGEIYCLVFQNRVNPNTLNKICTNIGEYWISPKSDDIRPYGICIKKLPKSQN